MMSLVQPFQPRCTVSEGTEGLRISIPSKRSWVIVFFLAWLCLWTTGGISTARSLTHRFSLFLAFWMVGWPFGEIAVGYAVLYAIGGREIILANSETLTCRTEIFGLGYGKSYLAREIRDLRFQPESGAGKSHTASRIAFDYGAKTMRFGADIEEAEAAELISRIRQRCAISDTLRPEESGIKFWQQR